jgi:hypothetical protein
MSEETILTEASTDEEVEEILQETSEDSEESLVEEEASEESSEEAELEEAAAPRSKPSMVRALFNQLQDTKKTKLEANYDKIMKSLTALEEEDDSEEEDDDKKKNPFAKKEESKKTLKKEDVDISADLSALFNDESDLSDEFKAKATTIFEAALIAKVNDELEKIENKFDEELSEARDENLTAMTEKVDEYLSYAIDEWSKENELAITKGLQAEISEEFITGLRNLFAEHYIEIPDEKIDVADTLADRVDKLEGDINERIEQNIEMQKQINEYKKTEVLTSLSDGLADTELEKLKDLSEGVDFEDVEQYTNALGTLKENYFPKTGKAPQQLISEEQETDGGVISETSGTMSAYAGAIGRTVRK